MHYNCLMKQLDTRQNNKNFIFFMVCDEKNYNISISQLLLLFVINCKRNYIYTQLLQHTVLTQIISKVQD